MAEKTFAAFFSYVHADDEHDNGRLTAIRKWLEEEISAQTGEPFEIFQDRDDIHWGHAWEERINGTLDNSTFLVAVITPRYLRSEYCRKEFERFTEREKKLGRNDLLLPLLYMDTPALSNKSDSIAAAISSRQYADWRTLRFEPWTNPDVTKRLSQLAKMICDGMIREVHPKPVVKLTNSDFRQVTTAQQETNAVKQTADAEKREPANPVEPYTLIVDPMPRRGDYTSISKAIANAEPGSRILIRPGFYKEGLVLNKPLELVGDGERDEIVIEANGTEAILFETEFGRVSNLTLRQVGGGQFFGVDIKQGRLELEDCNITSYSLACVGIHNGADPRLRRNQIHDGVRSGVLIYESSKGTLEDNEVWGNALAGIDIQDNSDPTLRRNHINNGKQNGVLVWNNAKGTFEDNDIFNNARAGVEIRTGSDPTLGRNRIHDGKSTGVFVHSDGKGTFEDNDIFNNTFTGVEIRSGGNPTLHGNRIKNNKGSGIYIHDNGGGRFENNEISGNRNPWNIDDSSKNKVEVSENIEE